MKTWMMITIGLIATFGAYAQQSKNRPTKAEQQSGITVVGNGGDVVDCGEKEPLLLLDMHEMKLEHSDVNFQIRGKTEKEKRDYILAQVSKVSKYQAKILEEALDQYDNNSKPERDLVDVPDSQHIFFPEGCQVRQIVIQHRTNGISRFKVDPDLLKRLDYDQKVYLAFHEAFYAEAIDLGHQNSIGTRALIRFINPNYYGGHMEDLMKARATYGFTVFDEMANGDVVILDPSQYDKLYQRYSKKITWRKEYQPKAIHFRNGKSLYEKNNNKLTVITSDDGSRIKTLAGIDLDPKFFNLPDSIKDISKINFENHTVVSKSNVDVIFDGHRYTCSAQEEIPVAGGKIRSCKGNTDQQKLPVRFTKRLLNNSKSYMIDFHYNDGRESGIKFKNLDTQWRMGFTPREDLHFKSYEEDWTTQRTTLELTFDDTKEPNTIKMGEGQYAPTCDLFSGKTVFSMKNQYPFILEGQIWFKAHSNKVKNIIEYTGCSIPAGSTSYRLEKFKRDENGNLISGEFTEDAKVLFAGATTRVKKPVFKNNVIVSAILIGEAKAYYKGNYRGLIPGLVYNILEKSGVEMIPNPKIIKKTPQGWWEVLKDINVGAGWMTATLAKSSKGGDQEVHTNINHYSPVFTEDFILLKGVLTKPAELPVCITNQDTEKTEITVRTVDAWFEIKSRRMTNSEGDLCYWIKDTRRK